MPADSTSPHERIAASFTRLALQSKQINAVSNEFSKPVSSLEESIKRLNVGVECWTVVEEHSLSRDATFRQDVGYTMLNDQWCLAIRTFSGPDDDPEHITEREWRFNESPRHLRVKAIDALPDLLEALVKASEATMLKMQEKLGTAQSLAGAVAALSHTKAK